MSQAARFRELLRRDGMVVAPGAYDCSITARMIARAPGSTAVYMTGRAGTGGDARLSRISAWSRCRRWSRTPAASPARSSCRSSPTPIPATATNSMCRARCANTRSARRRRHPYRGPGLSQEMRPSRRQGDRAALEDWLAKIRAAAAARRSGDFALIARTDSRAVAGFDEAVARGNAALAAGADMSIHEAPPPLDEVAAVPRLVPTARASSTSCARQAPPTSISAGEAERMGYMQTGRSCRAC